MAELKYTEIIFQMENLPIIQHLNGIAQCFRLGTAGAIAKATSAICARVSAVYFESVPEESYFFGDLAASVASEGFLSFLQTGLQFRDLQLPRGAFI